MLSRLLPYEIALVEKFAAAADTPVLIQVHTDVPMNGKRAIAIQAPLPTTFGDLKRLIATQERLFPSNELHMAADRMTIHIHELERDVGNSESLHGLGYEFPPLLHVSGFGHEYFLRVRGSPGRWAVPWWPHLSATDLVRHVCTRLKPFDLRYCRIVCDKPAATREASVEDETDVCSAFTTTAVATKHNGPVVIPIRRSFQYGVGVEVMMNETVARFRAARAAARAAAIGRLIDVAIAAGFNGRGIGIDEQRMRSADAANEAMAASQVTFVRSQDGVPVTFIANFIGVPNATDVFTIAQVRDAILDFCKRGGEPQLAREAAKRENKVVLPIVTATIQVSLVLSAEQVARTQALTDGPEYAEVAVDDPYARLRDPFDDDDEEIAPHGVKRVYCHDNDLLLRDSNAVKSLATELKFTREADTMRAHLERACELVHQEPLTLSFNPPRNQYLAVERPHFVEPADDFRIPHLSDLGVLPGSEVFVEYYDPQRLLWSGELAKQWDGQERAAQMANSTTLVGVRSCRGTLHHIPVTRGVTTAGEVMDRLFCSTGDLPMFFLIAADGGRLLQSCDPVLGDAGNGGRMLPSPTLYAVHRPRPWLGESLFVNLQTALGKNCDTGLNALTDPKL